jgi:hypothetical protein
MYFYFRKNDFLFYLYSAADSSKPEVDCETAMKCRSTNGLLKLFRILPMAFRLFCESQHNGGVESLIYSAQLEGDLVLGVAEQTASDVLYLPLTSNRWGLRVIVLCMSV